jgi:hypothetical protein
MFNFSGLNTSSEDGFSFSFNNKVEEHVGQFLKNADDDLDRIQTKGVGALWDSLP